MGLAVGGASKGGKRERDGKRDLGRKGERWRGREKERESRVWGVVCCGEEGKKNEGFRVRIFEKRKGKENKNFMPFKIKFPPKKEICHPK